MRHLPVVLLLYAVWVGPVPLSPPSSSIFNEATGRTGPNGRTERVEDFTQSRSSGELDRLIDQYRHGDATAAVGEFASWDAKRVQNAVLSWEALRTVAKSSLTDTDVRPIAALAMLHTSAALQRDTFARSGRALVSGTPNYYEQAHRLVKTLAERARDESAIGLRTEVRTGLRRFCRNWFVLATAMWMSAWECGKAADTADSGLASLGDDAELFLAAGSVAETRAVRERNALPGACDSPWAMTSVHGSFVASTRTLDDAQSSLHRALALDSTLAEARLHLGRVFYWSNRSANAVRELERAVADAQDADREFIGYLAALFLGQVHEEAHRRPEARRAYSRAIELNPRGYVAHVALSHLLIAAGQVEDGWAHARTAFGRVQQKAISELDPWALYRDAQAWRAARLRQEMDAWVRQ